jgi:hypothetical protein
LGEFSPYWANFRQIGRIFANRAIVYFGTVFENLQKQPKIFGATAISAEKKVTYMLLLTKNRLGLILGYILQTHPVTLSHREVYKQLINYYRIFFPRYLHFIRHNEPDSPKQLLIWNAK